MSEIKGRLVCGEVVEGLELLKSELKNIPEFVGDWYEHRDGHIHSQIKQEIFTELNKVLVRWEEMLEQEMSWDWKDYE